MLSVWRNTACQDIHCVECWHVVKDKRTDQKGTTKIPSNQLCVILDQMSRKNMLKIPHAGKPYSIKALHILRRPNIKDSSLQENNTTDSNYNN